MIAKKFGIGTLFLAMFLISMTLVPAVSAQAEKESTDKFGTIIDINGQITPKSTTSTLGEEACDLLTAALWTVDQYIDDSRIGTAEDKLSKGAAAFRNNQITTGFNYLKQGVVISFNLATDWVSVLVTWVYNKLVNAANNGRSLLIQFGLW